MSGSVNAVKLLLIYSISLMLALAVGYMLAAGSDFESLGAVLIVVGGLCVPLLLRHHRALEFFCWNSTLGTYFLPGQAPLWLSLGATSLVLTLIDRTLRNGKPMINVPKLTWPLILFVFVVLITMFWRGGIGIQWMGASGLSGGGKYLWVLGACWGYFAMTGQQIPVEKAPIFYTLFFLGGLTGFVGPLAAWVGGPLAYMQYVFTPVEGVAQTDLGFRIKGMAYTGGAIVGWILARYGFSGVFHTSKIWRPMLFIVGLIAGLLSGYRTALITSVVTVAVLFVLEGHHRTPRLLAWAVGGLLGLALLFPLTPYLPTPVQRTLTFLPLPVDQSVRFDADSTVEWRKGLWDALLEDVPTYFWLGKGLAIRTMDMEWAETIGRFGADQWYRSYLTGEHHNGLLSVTLSFGIWGVITFIWFVVAAFWALCCNFLYGRPELKTVNAYTVAAFVATMVVFFSVSGTLYWMMKDFTGLVALSIALNGGVATKLKGPPPTLG